MARDDLTKDELRTLLTLVSGEIDASRFPFLPRVKKLETLRRKLRKALGEPGNGPE